MSEEMAKKIYENKSVNDTPYDEKLNHSYLDEKSQQVSNKKDFNISGKE